MSKAAKASPAQPKDPASERLELVMGSTSRSREECQEALKLGGNNVSKAVEILMDPQQEIHLWQNKKRPEKKREQPAAPARPPRQDRPPKKDGVETGRRTERDRDGPRKPAAAAAPAPAAPAPAGGVITFSAVRTVSAATPWNVAAASRNVANPAPAAVEQAPALPSPSVAAASKVEPAAPAPVDASPEPSFGAVGTAAAAAVAVAAPAPEPEPTPVVAPPTVSPSAAVGTPAPAAAAPPAEPELSAAWDHWTDRNATIPEDYLTMAAQNVAGSAAPYAPAPRKVVFTTRDGVAPSNFVLCAPPQLDPIMQPMHMPAVPPAQRLMPHIQPHPPYGYHQPWAPSPEHWGGMYPQGREEGFGVYDYSQGYDRRPYPKEAAHMAHNAARVADASRPKGGRGGGGPRPYSNNPGYFQGYPAAGQWPGYEQQGYYGGGDWGAVPPQDDRNRQQGAKQGYFNQ